VKVVNLEPQAAANAMIAGTADVDAAMTYEPYLSAVRAKPEAGKIIATTLDYPMVMDTFGCTPKFLSENPKAAKALADSYFEAVEMIKKDPKKSFEIMGADVKQTGEAFEASPNTCAGRTAPPTRSSLPASTPPSARKPPTCCWKRHHQVDARPVQAGGHAPSDTRCVLK
jgi:ABC-type taurine transport system substrate-binding protein